MNNSEQPQQVTVDTFSAGMQFRGVWPIGTRGARSDADGEVTLTVPPLSAVVHRAAAPLARARVAPTPELTLAGGTVGGRAEVSVDVPGGGFNQVTFAYRPDGARDWQVLGTDDNAPYRVFHDVTDMPRGTLLEYRAIVRDHSGNRAAASASATVVAPPPPGGGGDVPAPQSVTVAGTFNSEVGCLSDWQQNCAAAHLTPDPLTGLWSRTFQLPAGTWEYKVAHDDSWDVNFGAEGVRGGGNIALTTTGGAVTFTYDPRTHRVTTSEAGTAGGGGGAPAGGAGAPAPAGDGGVAIPDAA